MASSTSSFGRVWSFLPPLLNIGTSPNFFPNLYLCYRPLAAIMSDPFPSLEPEAPRSLYSFDFLPLFLRRERTTWGCTLPLSTSYLGLPRTNSSIVCSAFPLSFSLKYSFCFSFPLDFPAPPLFLGQETRHKFFPPPMRSCTFLYKTSSYDST